MKLPGVTFIETSSWYYPNQAANKSQKGIPMTEQGLERKVGKIVGNALFGKKWKFQPANGRSLIKVRFKRIVELYHQCKVL